MICCRNRWRYRLRCASVLLAIAALTLCVLKAQFSRAPGHDGTRNTDTRPASATRSRDIFHQLYSIYYHRHFTCPDVCVLRSLQTSSFDIALRECARTNGCVVVSRNRLHDSYHVDKNTTGRTILCSCVERDAGDPVPAWGGVPFGFLNHAWDGAIRTGCSSFGPTLARLLADSEAINTCMQQGEQQTWSIVHNDTFPVPRHQRIPALHETFSEHDGKKAICESNIHEIVSNGSSRRNRGVED